MRIFLAVFLALLLIPLQAFGWEGEVVRVIDGDTVRVRNLRSGREVNVRLQGVDCPEGAGRSWPAQPYNEAATLFVQLLLPVGSRVSVPEVDQDRYARPVGAIITLPDGRDIREELVREGLAWVSPKYCKRCFHLKDLEEEARAENRGLWQDDEPVPPWDWRKGQQ